LEFFAALPPLFRRDPTVAPSAVELAMPDWLALKAAVARHFAWAVPTDEAIDVIAAHAASVVEIGCGSGYWAWMMAQAGIAVTAFDTAVPPFSWHRIEAGTEREAENHPDKALFLCWPPANDRMAHDALTHYHGDHVIYVGEWLGGSAEPAFFARLVQDFAAIAGAAIPQWYMRDDSLIIFRRRRSGGDDASSSDADHSTVHSPPESLPQGHGGTRDAASTRHRRQRKPHAAVM